MKRTPATPPTLLAGPVVVAILALAATAGRAGGDENDGDAAGVLQERDVPALAPGEETATTLIVDARTHRPVPGARLTWYAEMEGLRAPALGSAVADSHGLASLDWTELATWHKDGHFIVTADGYAAAHEYGEFPPEEIELSAGRDVRGRIVDLLGRPVADADVEVFLGCGHGPILDFVQTDAAGHFAVRGQDTAEAQLWLEAPGTAADYLELGDGDDLGGGERVFLLEPGGIAEGVVLDSAGRPLEGVEVRSFQRHRGPVGLTDRRGRFRLVGLEEDASLYFSHPYASDGWAILDGTSWRPGVPLRLRLTPFGFATETQERETVLVRIIAPDGRIAEDADVLLVRDADGIAYDSEPSDDVPLGTLLYELPPGVYVPAAPYAFEGWDLDPTPIEVGRGLQPRVTLRATPAVTLRVEGKIPSGADAYVAVPGASEFLDDPDDLADEDAPIHVPPDGPVVVTITWLGGTWFFEAGDAVDGTRVAHVAVPSPHRIRVPDELCGEPLDDVQLLFRGRPCSAELRGSELLTYASGDLVLRLESGSALVHVPLTLPAEPGATIAPDVPEAGPPHVLRVLLPEGLDEWVDVEITEEDGDGGEAVHGIVHGPIVRPMDGPVWVRVERADHVVFSRHVTEPGDVRVTWGDASLAFHVVDAGGDHVEAVLAVDGVLVPQRDADEFTVLRALGLAAGEHDVLILPRDDVFLAREMRIDLGDGEVLRRRVELSER